MPYGGDPWFALVFLLAIGGITVYRRIEDWRTPDEGTVEHAHQLYTTGEIDHAELERRLDVIQDPEADRIRQSVERVSGIGEATSFAIAVEFRSLDELRRADTERLTRTRTSARNERGRYGSTSEYRGYSQRGDIRWLRKHRVICQSTVFRRVCVAQLSRDRVKEQHLQAPSILLSEAGL